MMTLTEAADVLWELNADLIRSWPKVDEHASYFFGVFTACARTVSLAHSNEAIDAAIVWVGAKTGDTYKESLRLFDEINETEEASA